MNVKTRNCRYCSGTGKEIDSVSVGNEMLALRKAKDVKQCNVAEFMGYSAAYISDLEKGKRGWSDRLIASYKSAITNLSK